MESSAPGVVAAPSSLINRVRRGAAARKSHAAAKLAVNQEAEAKVGADVGLTGPAEAVEAAEAKKKGMKAYANIRHKMKKAERDHQKGLRGALLLAQMTEQAFMEHQLAACHFTFYNFWVFFVPLNLLIAATSILAFIGGDSDINDDGNYINTIVGCLAAFSVFLNSCDRLLSYKSRADMHTGAKMVCKELLTKLDFTLIKYATKDPRYDEQPVDDGEQELFDEIKTKFQQVQESCTSPIPDPISQAFRKMKSSVVFDLGLDPGDTDGGGSVRFANVLLCDEITKAWMWPMRLPGAANFNSARAALHKDGATRAALREANKMQPTSPKAAK